MRENLKTSKFRNNTEITNVTDNGSWAALTTEASCYYNNDTGNYTIYGKLYNWYAVNDSSGLCPTGWHVPTHDEWTTLERTICTSSTCVTDFPYDNTSVGLLGTDEGGKLKEMNVTVSGTYKVCPSGRLPILRWDIRRHWQ